MRRLGPAVMVVALLFAAAVRIVGLGQEPLDPAEASQSIAAWWTVDPPGEELSRLEPRAASPLLLGLDVALFWLLDSASDPLARWVPAATGVVLVLLALLLRPRAWSMLAPTAVLLATDPWLVAASRRASGAILAAGAAIACHLLLRRLQTVQPAPALAGAAHRLWWWWAVAAGLLAVAGAGTWDFLPPVVLGAALAAGGAPLRSTPRPHPGWLLATAAAAAVVATSTGLVQWSGPALITSSLESWLSSWTLQLGEMSIANVVRAGGAVLLYQLALAAMAAWGLLRVWSGRGAGTASSAGRDALPLLVWLGWGAAMQLRSSRGPEVWLALEVPMLLAAAIALEDLLAAMERGAGGAARRVALAVLVAIAIGAAVAGTEAVPRAAVSLPSARRLAADLAVLLERPAAERPRIEVVTGHRIDGVLGWYLRDARPLWVASASAASDDAPRVVLSITERPIEEAPAATSAPRYALRTESNQVHVVEMQ